MTTLQVDVNDELVALLRQGNQPASLAAREMIVLELCRRGTISSGKAAELLGMGRIDFICRASQMEIPFFDMTEDE
jgi:hypothetical protein